MERDRGIGLSSIGGHIPFHALWVITAASICMLTRILVARVVESACHAKDVQLDMMDSKTFVS